MDSELLAYIILGTAALSLLLLLIGAFVPSGPRRGPSDWIMIGGMLVSFLAIVAFMVLIFVVQRDSYGPPRNYQFWQSVMMAVGFAMPGGVLIFSGGFILSRFEARRRAAELQFFMQGFHPYARSPLRPPAVPTAPPGGMPPQPPAGPPFPPGPGS